MDIAGLQKSSADAACWPQRLGQQWNKLGVSLRVCQNGQWLEEKYWPTGLCKHLCPLTDCRGLMERTLQRAYGQKHSVSFSCLGGIEGLVIPIMRRNKPVGAVVGCFLHEKFHQSEELVRLCSAKQYDCKLLLELADQMPRYGSGTIEAMGQLLEESVRSACADHGAAEEIDSLAINLAGSYEELSLVYKITSGLKVTEDPGDHFGRMADDVLDVLGSKSLLLWVHRADSCDQGKLYRGGCDDVPKEKLDAIMRRLAAGLCSGQYLVMDKAAGGQDLELLGQGGFESLLAVPLKRSEQRFGILAAFNKKHGQSFDSTDIKLLTSVADQTAMFLENCYLVQDNQELLLNLLRSLVSAIDAKDPYTSGHSERVASICRQMAQALGWDRRWCRSAYLAGLLHDIGKIGIADSVLSKPGKLTGEEFEQMKHHPQIGAKILGRIKQIKDIIPGVLYHHERYDGGGYPEGLSGQEIPAMGTLVGLADCFDALNSDRTYHSKLSIAQVRKVIDQQSGRQFDPVMVGALSNIHLEDSSQDQGGLEQLSDSSLLAADGGAFAVV